jgi:hypothetical protein
MSEEHVYDTRALTDDQRSLADDIALAMGYGHEDGCAVWREDPDGCSCPLLQGIADGLAGARVVEVTQEFGYDPATRRGDRLVRQPFRPHPLSAEAQAGAGIDVERLAEAMWNVARQEGNATWAEMVARPGSTSGDLYRNRAARLAAEYALPTEPEAK